MFSRTMISRPPHTQNTILRQQEKARTGKQHKQNKSQQAIMHRGWGDTLLIELDLLETSLERSARFPETFSSLNPKPLDRAPKPHHDKCCSTCIAVKDNIGFRVYGLA